MKKQIQSLFLGAVTLGTMMFVSATATGQTILQTVTEGAGTDWTAASWGGPPAVAATSGNNYETPSSSFTVRTPNKNLTGLYATNFGGNSLQIDTGGILYLKHGGNAADDVVVNLLLNGGAMTFHGGFAPTPAPVGGTLQVLAASTINSDQTGANAADIWLLSSVSGSSGLTVNMLSPGANNVVLFGNNAAYSGNWVDANGGLMIEGGTTNALGSGSVTLQVADAFLGFNSTNNLVANNPIYGNGYVVKWNTNTVTLGGSNTFAGSLIISNGILKISSSSAISNAAVVSLASGTLDASLVGGLSLNIGGQQMNCNGTVIGGLTVSAADTLNFNLTPTTNNILSVAGSLTLSGNPTLNLASSGYKASGVYRLINYTGTIQGGGSFTLVPPSGSTETFQLDISTPGEVNLIVTGVLLNLTWVGDGSANNWDTTSANWTGDSTVYSTVGDNVTFNDAGSSVPDIYVVAAVTPNSMTVSNSNEQYIFDGAGIVTSGGLDKLGTNEVDFTSTGNDFSGPINIQAGTLSVGYGATGSLGTGPISNNGVLSVNMSYGGVAFNAPISGSGSLVVTGGGASVTIGATNSFTGPTTIGDGCQLNISTSAALGNSTNLVTVLANGRLGVTTAVGAMTVPQPLTINGTGISGAPGALYVNTVGNNVTWSGPVTIASPSQIRAVNVNARMNFSGAVLGTNVSLECTAGNTVGDVTSVITFSNTLSLGSSGSFTADGLATVVLAGRTNLWGGGTTVASGTLLVNGLLDGGPVAVNPAATLGGLGTILNPVTVDGNLAPGNSGTGILAVSNDVTIESDGSAVMALNRTNAQNASLLSATSVTYGGTLTVNNIGGPLQAGDTFTLFAGAITGAFDVTNLPALSSTNLYWNTALLSSGIIEVASSSAPAPALTAPAVSGTNFTLQVAASQSGFNYVLQATPSLAPANWSSIQTNAGTGGTLTFTAPIIPGTRQEFYRISVQ